MLDDSTVEVVPADGQPSISSVLALKPSDRFTFSYEIYPPRNEASLAKLEQSLGSYIEDGPLFVDVTWGVGGHSASTTLRLCEQLLKFPQSSSSCGHPIVNMHLTCTNMPAGLVESALASAHEKGVRNIVALRGDPPVGTSSKAGSGGNPDGFTCALDLVKLMVDRRISAQEKFCITVAGYPEGHPSIIAADGLAAESDLKADITYLKRKIDAGGECVITQLFFDVRVFLRFHRMCREEGIDVPIIPGLCVFPSYASFQRMTTFCKTLVPPALRSSLEAQRGSMDGSRDALMQHCVELCRTLVHYGHHHLHFYTLNDLAGTRAVLSAVSSALSGPIRTLDVTSSHTSLPHTDTSSCHGGGAAVVKSVRLSVAMQRSPDAEACVQRAAAVGSQRAPSGGGVRGTSVASGGGGSVGGVGVVGVERVGVGEASLPPRISSGSGAGALSGAGDGSVTSGTSPPPPLAVVADGAVGGLPAIKRSPDTLEMYEVPQTVVGAATAATGTGAVAAYSTSNTAAAAARLAAATAQRSSIAALSLSPTSTAPSASHPPHEPSTGAAASAAPSSRARQWPSQAGVCRPFHLRLADSAVVCGDVTFGPVGAPVLVLLHGWTGSAAAFDWVVPHLSPTCTVVRYDLRFHGSSSHPPWGRRVAKLAADLEEVLREIATAHEGAVIVMGCSLGAAVIFAYAELYGLARVAGAVVVDQAPLQYAKDDWALGSLGMRDDSDFERMAKAFRADPAAFADALIDDCTGTLPLPEGAKQRLKAATLAVDKEAMISLMDDHTRNDWRGGLRHGVWENTPLLAVAGAESKIFPVEGSLWAARATPRGRCVTLKGSGHWPHIDAAAAFAAEVVQFAFEDAAIVVPRSGGLGSELPPSPGALGREAEGSTREEKVAGSGEERLASGEERLA